MISELTPKIEQQLINYLYEGDLESIERNNYSEDFFNNLTLSNYDGCRKTFFQFAVERSNFELIKYLISKKCDVNAQDEFGRTALHTAISNRKLEIVSLLLNSEADPNIQDLFGRTPLHYLVLHYRPTIKSNEKIIDRMKSYASCVEMLLQFDANVKIEDHYGFRPCDTKTSEIIELLKKYGVDYGNPRLSNSSITMFPKAQEDSVINRRGKEELKIDPNSNQPLTKSQKLTIVFDIDNVLAEHESVSEEVKLYLLRKSALILAVDKEHQIYPGVIELMRTLFSRKNINVAFFSSGVKERNTEFVKKLLTIALGPEKYAEIENSVVILSRNDLTSSDTIASIKTNLMYQCYGLSRGSNKKDISKALFENALLKNGIFIDDDPSYIYYDQERNFLRCDGSSPNYALLKQNPDENEEQRHWQSEEYFYKYNKIFYLAGVLSECISIFEKGESVQEFLFSVQFQKTAGDLFRYELNYELIKNKKCYVDGLELLRQVNPELCFVSSQDYSNTLSSTITEKEQSTINEFKAKEAVNDCSVM